MLMRLIAPDCSNSWESETYMKTRTKLLTGALALAGLLYWGRPAYVSQGSLCMPTTGTVSGLTFAQAVNTALDALLTSNSGSAAPTNPCGGVAKTGQMW